MGELDGCMAAAGTGGPPGLPVVPTVLVVAVALVDVDGRVLIAQRPEGNSLAGLWEFPGGKVDPGETPEAALVREWRAELGIDTAESDRQRTRLNTRP